MRKLKWIISFYFVEKSDELNDGAIIFIRTNGQSFLRSNLFVSSTFFLVNSYCHSDYAKKQRQESAALKPLSLANWV